MGHCYAFPCNLCFSQLPWGCSGQPASRGRHRSLFRLCQGRPGASAQHGHEHWVEPLLQERQQVDGEWGNELPLDWRRNVSEMWPAQPVSLPTAAGEDGIVVWWLIPDTWAEKIESFERINSMHETNRNFDSCNSCQRLVPSRWYEQLMPTAGSQPLTWVAWVKISVCFTYRMNPFETFEFFCSCIRGHCIELCPSLTVFHRQETHIMHKFDCDFYGSTLRICIVGFIRPEENFKSLGRLAFLVFVYLCN